MRNLTHSEALARAAVLSVESYDIALDLTRGAEVFGSETVVRFHAEPGSATFLELDGVFESGTLDGRPLTLSGNRVALDGLGGEHEVRVTATCSYTRSGEGLHRFEDPADGAVYVYSQAFLDDAQRFFACFDQPDLKAVLRISVRAPEGHVVRSGTKGELVDGVHVFAETRRLATYHAAVCAGPWVGVQEEHDGLLLGWWARASEAAHLEADELMAITKASFSHQQERFGSRYPFGETYDQVFVPEFNAGAMENPGMVTYSESSLLFRSRTTAGRRRLRAQVVAHEMAHMWFGNLVTMQWWDGIWLNESFAEYMGLDTVDKALPYDGVWADFALGRKAWGYCADQLPTTHPVAGEVEDNRAALQNFDGISYAKGASVLRQLVALLGEDVFFTGLRSYLVEHAWGNATLADLLRALEQASGRDLSPWAVAWLETSGTDTLRLTTEGGGRLTRDGDARRDHLLGVGAYEDRQGQLVLRERVLVELRGDAVAVSLTADLLLPNDGDLTFAKVRLDPGSLAVALDRLADVADPLARALLWGSLWDSLRDGELSAADHVRAVLSGVVAESDPSLVETLLAQARQAAALYAPPDQQDALLQQLADGSRAATTERGSDLQLVRVRAAVASTPDAGWLLSVLESPPEGLVVDQELRWLLLVRLAALGGIDEASIDAEALRDRTLNGELQALAALAALPLLESKGRVFAALVATTSTNAQVRTAGAAFWQREQAELLLPYVPRYLDALEQFWLERSPEMAAAASSSFFPGVLALPVVRDEVDARVARATVPGHRRWLREAADDLRRELHAQGQVPSGGQAAT